MTQLRLCFLCFTAVLMLSGCDGGVDVPLGVVSAVVEAVPETAGALRTWGQDAPLGPVEVYVDLSLSMRPYLSAGAATDQTTVYYRLLERLNDDLGGEVSFHGFGFLPDSSRQTLEPLSGVAPALDPTSYNRLNNDYAEAFSYFLADSTLPAPTRVLITDGVESDPVGGRRFGGIVAAADAWVRRGGVFAALVFRSTYIGRYFPEAVACAGGRLDMTCPNRPLVVFVLAQDASKLDRLAATLASGGLEPDYALRVGSGNDLTLTAITTIPPLPDERRESRLLRRVDTEYVPGFHPFVSAQIDNRAIDKATGFFPLSFDVGIPEDAPWGQLPQDEQVAFLQTLQPVVQAWAVQIGRDSVALFPVEPHIRGARVEMNADSASGTRLKVVVPVRRPAAPVDGNGQTINVRHFVWLVSLVPYESGQRLVPENLSAVNDCVSDACDRTLNLAPLLGAILRDDYVPGRALLLTEWRD